MLFGWTLFLNSVRLPLSRSSCSFLSLLHSILLLSLSPPLSFSIAISYNMPDISSSLMCYMSNWNIEVQKKSITNLLLSAVNGNSYATRRPCIGIFHLKIAQSHFLSIDVTLGVIANQKGIVSKTSDCRMKQTKVPAGKVIHLHVYLCAVHCTFDIWYPNVILWVIRVIYAFRGSVVCRINVL